MKSGAIKPFVVELAENINDSCWVLNSKVKHSGAQFARCRVELVNNYTDR